MDYNKPTIWLYFTRAHGFCQLQKQTQKTNANYCVCFCVCSGVYSYPCTSLCDAIKLSQIKCFVFLTDGESKRSKWHLLRIFDPVIIVSVHSKLNIVLRFFLVQKANTLDVARGNKIDTHFLRLFVRSGQKNISTGILQFCQLTGTYLRVFDHKSLSNVCSQLLCVRGNMSTGWKLSLSNRCRISSFFEMKK